MGALILFGVFISKPRRPNWHESFGFFFPFHLEVFSRHQLSCVRVKNLSDFARCCKHPSPAPPPGSGRSGLWLTWADCLGPRPNHLAPSQTPAGPRKKEKREKR